jgi:membrane-associated phospholipid phosphatase
MRGLISVLVVLLCTTTITGKEQHPWNNLWGNCVDAHTGTNLLYYGSAAAATGIMVATPWDKKAQLWFQKQNPIGDEIGYGMVVAGWFWHLVPASAMYLGGWYVNSHDVMGAGAAGLQAITMASIVTVALKFASGRRQPLKDGVHDFYGPSGHRRSDDPADFAPFNNNLGNESLRFAWPSGHTSSTVAFVSAMAAYYPDKLWIKLIGYPASLFMALSMVDYDAHWTSDVIAGALIGHAIGWTVGRNFRLAGQVAPEGSGKAKTMETSFSVMPSPNRLEARITGAF